MAYIDKIQVGGTNYDLQDSALKSAITNTVGKAKSASFQITAGQSNSQTVTFTGTLPSGNLIIESDKPMPTGLYISLVNSVGQTVDTTQLNHNSLVEPKSIGVIANNEVYGIAFYLGSSASITTQTINFTVRSEKMDESIANVDARIAFTFNTTIPANTSISKTFFFPRLMKPGKYKALINGILNPIYVAIENYSATAIVSVQTYENNTFAFTTAQMARYLSIYIPSQAKTLSDTNISVTIINDDSYDYLWGNLGEVESSSHTFSLTAGQSESLEYFFQNEMESGLYRIDLGNYAGGQIYISPADKSGNVLGQVIYWENGQAVYMYISSKVHGIKLYHGASAIATSTNLTVTFTRMNVLDHTEIQAKTLLHNTRLHVTGEGSSSSPYQSPDGSGGLNPLINSMYNKGGKIRVQNGIYVISTPVIMNYNSINIEGDSWNYPGFPNGVYQSNDGTKLRLTANTIPVLKYVSGNGCRISQIGFNGIVNNGDTAGLFRMATSKQNCGILFGGTYADQFLLQRIGCTGLAAGIVFTPDSAGYVSADAFIIDDVNLDGCDIGFFANLVGSSSFFTYCTIKNSVIADNPAYGLYIGSTVEDTVRGCTIKNNLFVRNAGKFSDGQKSDFTDGLSAVYIKGFRKSIFSENIIHTAGTYANTTDASDRHNEYEPTSCGLIIQANYSMINHNSINETQSHSAVFYGDSNKIGGNQFISGKGIKIEGNYNQVHDNFITVSSGDGITVDGNSNVLRGNYTNKIVVTGNSNTIHRNANETVVVESGASHNVLIGFAQSQITDNGTGTIII